SLLPAAVPGPVRGMRSLGKEADRAYRFRPAGTGVGRKTACGRKTPGHAAYTPAVYRPGSDPSPQRGTPEPQAIRGPALRDAGSRVAESGRSHRRTGAGGKYSHRT